MAKVRKFPQQRTAPTAARKRSATSRKPVVGLVMGSKSDWETMSSAAAILDELGVAYEAKVVSAHRTPKRMVEYAESAEERGLEVIVAGAGGAAHLPGMIASLTVLPVLGVPVAATGLLGLDALLSIVQMPKGVPVGTLAVGAPGAVNAGLLAAAIVSRGRPGLRERLRAWRRARTDEVLGQELP